MEGGSEGDGEGRRGGGRTEGRGREKSSNCTLSFKGAKNFIPGKALFFLSLESSASTPLIAAAVHTHGYFHTAVCEDRRGILQSPAPTPTRPSLPPSRPSPVLPSVGQSRQQTQPSLEPLRADQVSSSRGGRGHRSEEAASPGMHGSGHDQTCIVSNFTPLAFSFPPSLFIYLASCSHLISTRFILPSLPP